MKRVAVNFIAFQVGWFACVLGAANGLPWLGVLVGFVVVWIHLSKAARPGPELRLLTLAVLMGLVLDSVLVSSGWLRYPSGHWLPGLAPYWILAMWALFATTLNLSMAWIKANARLAALLGAVFGPLSYIAGQRLGGVEFVDFGLGVTALAVAWAVAMPLLVVAANRLDGVKPLPAALPLQGISRG